MNITIKRRKTPPKITKKEVVKRLDNVLGLFGDLPASAQTAAFDHAWDSLLDLREWLHEASVEL